MPRVPAWQELDGAGELAGKEHAVLHAREASVIELRERIAAVDDDFGAAVGRDRLRGNLVGRPLEQPESLDERPERGRRVELAVDHARCRRISRLTRWIWRRTLFSVS